MARLMEKDDAICFEIDAEQVDFFEKLEAHVKSVALKNFQTWWPSEFASGEYPTEAEKKRFVEKQYNTRLNKFSCKHGPDGSELQKPITFSTASAFMKHRRDVLGIKEDELPAEFSRRWVRINVPKGKRAPAYNHCKWISKSNNITKPTLAEAEEDMPSKEGGDYVLPVIEFKYTTLWFSDRMGFGLNLDLKECILVKGLGVKAGMSSVLAFDEDFASDDEEKEAKSETPGPKKMKVEEGDAASSAPTAESEPDEDFVADPYSGGGFDPGNLVSKGKKDEK